MKRCNKCEEHDDPITHKCSVRKIKPVATTDDALRESVTAALRDVLNKSAMYANVTWREPDLGSWRQQLEAILAAARAYGEQCRVDELEQGYDFVLDVGKSSDYKRGFEDAVRQLDMASDIRIAALTSKRKEQA